MPGNLQVNDCSGERIVLERIEPTEARETLGVFLAMDGNNKRHIQELQSKAETYGKHMTKGFVNKFEAWHALKSTILMTLQYPLEILSLTQEQWQHILAPIMLTNLPKAGFMRHFPRAIIFGPSSEMGLGLMHPFHLQFLRQIVLVLDKIITPSITGELLISTAEQLILEAGLSGPISAFPMDILRPVLTDCWWADLLAYMYARKLRFHTTLPDLAASKRSTRDILLMEAFIAQGYRKSDLAKLIACRQFLRVNWLSELCSADGTTLEAWAWSGNTPPCLDHSEAWPRRPPPAF
jgi:hypothetical protein